jgi:hypothetical protein
VRCQQWQGVSRASDGRIQKIPHKPKKGCNINPSSFRPRVCTSDRLQAWRTPHTLSFQSSVHKEIPAETMSILFQSIATITRRTHAVIMGPAYRASRSSATLTVPEASRMPASPNLLAAFAASGMSKVVCWLVDGRAKVPARFQWCGPARRRFGDASQSEKRSVTDGTRVRETAEASASDHRAHACSSPGTGPLPMPSTRRCLHAWRPRSAVEIALGSCWSLARMLSALPST